METTMGNAIAVDMSKAHHWLIVQSRKHDILHVTCVDCDESREYPFKHLGSFVEWLGRQEDIQVLSWIDADASA